MGAACGSRGLIVPAWAAAATARKRWLWMRQAMSMWPGRWPRPPAAGAPGWQSFYDGAGRFNDTPVAITVDGAGNVYVTGTSDARCHVECAAECYYGCTWFCSTICDQTDFATVKYDANGKQLWAVQYHGPGAGYDFAHAIAVDGAGNVYVTGASVGVASNLDYATIKYSPAGRQLWAARYHGLDATNDIPT